MTLYTDRKPREAVARALVDAGCLGTSLAFTGPEPTDTQNVASFREFDTRAALRAAAIALNTLRELGFITSEGLDAIHAEEDANGEPRSSVVPGGSK